MSPPEALTKTYIVLEVSHAKELPHLANMIAGRAWSIDGVRGVEVVDPTDADAAHAAGFTLEEISLGTGEVHRS